MKLVLLTSEEIALLLSVLRNKVTSGMLIGSQEYVLAKAATEPVVAELTAAQDRETFHFDRMKWLDGQQEIMELREAEKAALRDVFEKLQSDNLLRRFAQDAAGDPAIVEPPLGKVLDDAISDAIDNLKDLPPLDDLPPLGEELAAESEQTFEQHERTWNPPRVIGVDLAAGPDESVVVTLPIQPDPACIESEPEAIQVVTPPAVDDRPFGERLHEARLALGLSQRILGKAVNPAWGTPQMEISKLESGKKIPDPSLEAAIWGTLEFIRVEQSQPTAPEAEKAPVVHVHPAEWATYKTELDPKRRFHLQFGQVVEVVKDVAAFRTMESIAADLVFGPEAATPQHVWIVASNYLPEITKCRDAALQPHFVQREVLQQVQQDIRKTLDLGDVRSFPAPLIREAA